MKRLSCVLLAVVLMLSCILTGCGKKGEDGLSITVSHQPYSHGLPSYIADVNGVFEENGLDVEILWFSGGNTQNEALGADEWEAGAYGSAPAIAAGIASSILPPKASFVISSNTGRKRLPPPDIE